MDARAGRTHTCTGHNASPLNARMTRGLTGHYEMLIRTGGRERAEFLLAPRFTLVPPHPPPLLTRSPEFSVPSPYFLRPLASPSRLSLPLSMDTVFYFIVMQRGHFYYENPRTFRGFSTRARLLLSCTFYPRTQHPLLRTEVELIATVQHGGPSSRRCCNICVTISERFLPLSTSSPLSSELYLTGIQKG